MKKKSRFTFVRHGQTSANIDKVWHGQTDTELTDLGKHQARQLGQYFKRYMQPDVIYSSPLQRAHLTAREIAQAHNLTVELDPRLMEFHLGDWEGMPFVDIDKNKIIDELRDNPAFTAPNGESQHLVRKRMVEAIDDIIHRHPEQNVVIVAHGVSIAIAFAHYLHDDTTQWMNYTKDNTAVSEICFDTKKLLSFNKTDHLS